MAVYELRHYVAIAGRERALRDRFENGTLALFDRLGVRVVDFWETSPPGELWYLLEWESEVAMRERWTAFKADERWLALKAASEADGPLIASITSTLLTRAPFFTPR